MYVEVNIHTGEKVYLNTPALLRRLTALKLRVREITSQLELGGTYETAHAWFRSLAPWE